MLRFKDLLRSGATSGAGIARLVGAVFGAALLLVGGFAPSGANGAAINIATGGPTGNYFVLGNALCLMLQENKRSLFLTDGGTTGTDDQKSCQAIVSEGSVENVGLLESGAANFAIVQSDVAFSAERGEASFRGRPANNLRSVFSAYVEPFHVVVRRDAGIDDWRDLEGRRINIGSAGSGQRATFEALLRAVGLRRSDFRQARELGSTEQYRALCDGTIDAFGFTVGAPSEAMGRTLRDCDAKLLTVDGRAVEQLVAASPYFVPVAIAGGTYDTETKPVETFGVVATLLTTDAMSDDTVYRLVKSVFDNIAFVRELHPSFKPLDPKRMVRNGLSAPLHPGAARYFREKGLL